MNLYHLYIAEIGYIDFLKLNSHDFNSGECNPQTHHEIIFAGSCVTDVNPSPEIDATFPSKLLFNWFNRLAWTGYKKSLQEDDLSHLNPRDQSINVVPLFNANWEPKVLAARLSSKEQSANVSFGANTEQVQFKTGGVAAGSSAEKCRQNLSVFLPLVKTFGGSFLMGSVLKLFHDLLVFVSPVLLRRIIAFSETDEPVWRGVLYAACLLLFAMVQTMLLSQYFYRMYLVGMWAKASLISAIYRLVNISMCMI